MNLVPRISEGVRARAEEFGALIFTNRTPILALNRDAVIIWDMFDGMHTVAEIIECVADKRADDVEAAALVHEFIGSCVELGLIELESAEAL